MISLCVPSRGRPRTMLQFFRSACATAEGKFEVCAWLDQDDPTRGDYPQRHRIKYGYGPRPVHNGIVCTSELWTHAAGIASGEILGLIGDDSLFQTPGWDTAITEAFKKVPDRILMVYPEDGTGRHRPETLFVSRKWIDAAGSFTPTGYPGWFSDNWIWCLAAEIGRAVYLPDVLIMHRQGFIRDRTYQDGKRSRMLMGNVQGIEDLFWSWGEREKRTQQAERLRAVMTSSKRIMPQPPPAWVRQVTEEPNPGMLTVVHCYSGDRQLVVDKLPLYLRHRRPVLVLSPDDAPVDLRTPGVECKSGGRRGYYGQASLDRQLTHLKMLLDTPYTWFLLNDADSLCISRELPRYLFRDSTTLWANVVRERRPHKSPYPKLALHPPYFAHRDVIERLIKVGKVKAHRITPFIDWLMLVLAEEAGVKYESYPDGVSFCAWHHDAIPETKALGHDYAHANRGSVDGASKMIRAVRGGATMLHSIKHKEVLAAVVQAHEMYAKRGEPAWQYTR